MKIRALVKRLRYGHRHEILVEFRARSVAVPVFHEGFEVVKQFFGLGEVVIRAHLDERIHHGSQVVHVRTRVQRLFLSIARHDVVRASFSLLEQIVLVRDEPLFVSVLVSTRPGDGTEGDDRRERGQHGGTKRIRSRQGERRGGERRAHGETFGESLRFDRGAIDDGVDRIRLFFRVTRETESIFSQE